MSTMWALIEVCFADARRAEQLLEEFASRRELRIDPESALAGFVLWKGRLSEEKVARRAVTPRRSRAYAPVEVEIS